MAAYHIGGQPPCSRCTRRSSACRIHVVCPIRRPRRMFHSSVCAHRRPSYFRFALYGWRNTSDSESVCRIPRRGLKPLSLFTAGSPCNSCISPIPNCTACSMLSQQNRTQGIVTSDTLPRAGVSTTAHTHTNTTTTTPTPGRQTNILML